MSNENAQSISISGIGLCSSMGGYRDACAAYRAGLNRFAGDDAFKVMFSGEEEPTPLSVAPAPANIASYQGTGRLIKLVKTAYADFLDQYRKPLPDDLVVLLAMADPAERAFELDISWQASREQRLQAYMSLLLEPLFNAVNPKLNAAPLQAVFGERVAFARILKKAADMLSAGKASHCLLIVADSLLGENYLQEQLEQNALKTADNPVGYIPGEGAAVILVSRAAECNANTLSLTVAIEQGDETDNSAWLANNLITCIRTLVTQKTSGTAFPQLISDINGAENRAIELGTLLVKLKQTYPDAQIKEPQIPALGFGELGTLTGPVALATVLASVERAYASQSQFIILLSEESGRKAAIKLVLGA